MTDDDVTDFLDSVDDAPLKPKAEAVSEPEGDDPLSFLDGAGFNEDREVPNAERSWMKYHEFTLARNMDEVRSLIDACIDSGFCSLDLETTGLDNRIRFNEDGTFETVDKIVGYCICHDPKTGWYLPVRHVPDVGEADLNLPAAEVEAEITRLCKAAIPPGTPEAIAHDPLSWKTTGPPKVVIAFWNSQFDQEFLYPVTGLDWWHPESFEDGMLASFVVFSADKRLGLKPKSKQYLRDPDGNPYEMIELKELFHGKTKNINFATLAPDEPGVLKYTGADGICTYMLCQIPSLVPKCHESYRDTYRLEKQTSCTLRGMERNRVLILRDKVKAKLEEQREIREEIYARIQSFAKNNGVANLDPNSPKQLSDFLFEKAPKGIDITPKPEKNEASGQYKTDGDTLSKLAKKENAPPVLKDIVRFREVEKFIGTYLQSLTNNPDENNEIRVSFKQTGAGTGRFSAPAGNPDHGYSGIPIHGIPGGSEIRRSFAAREGYTMIKADFSAEELRIAANISGEPVWIDEFLNGDGDLHSITARAFFGKAEVSKDERSAGKTANFALLYGGGPQSIIRATGCNDIEARRRKQAFDRAVSTFAKWIKTQHKAVKKDRGVRTAFGRWLAIPDANSEDNKIRAACERHAVNYQIQGSGADIMKISLVLLHKAFHKRGWLRSDGDDSIRMLLTVHDEVVLEVRHDRIPEVVPMIVTLMESPWHLPRHPSWRVPLIVEPLLGFNWASGYDAIKVDEDYEPKSDEVVINGFCYSVTRKPRTDSDGNITESLDINEELDGKKFRVVDPPWLKGFELGKRYGKDIENDLPFTKKAEAAASPKAKAEAPKSPETVEVAQETVEAASEPEVSLVQANPLPQKEPSVESLRVSEDHVASEDQGGEVLFLRIERLTDQTVEQMVDFIKMAWRRSGRLIHVVDACGQTLVSPEMNLKVDQKELLKSMREYNLLSVDEY